MTASPIGPLCACAANFRQDIARAERARDLAQAVSIQVTEERDAAIRERDTARQHLEALKAGIR